MKTEYKYIQSNIFILYQLLTFSNLFIVYLFRPRDCKKKVSTRGRLVTIFHFTRPVHLQMASGCLAYVDHTHERIVFCNICGVSLL